ncbi:MAG: TRAP transporter large permease [Vicinamibacterales bacterium]|jgi:tripartite ATP-independent transporter DctM subunit|nr:C4-dicarboxylate ABC transporter permease [Acidobacteriota bacterium]MDP6371585.1 TRAP transporter large permease [Vicinamibacterales bacterium]MDP6609301.1 TRAP transporter large permease [Vicinamibacterales bacterium]HAK55164.1 C4-dicarboxylate ABC transporter permease [Acidobacteriota bacterium]|tara:strand:- start:24461 stop:25726 length:1266 start_codon:yes stop_codon:yes gene_type:complete
MTLAAIFLGLLLFGLPVAVVLGVSAGAYIVLTDNTVLFQSYMLQLFGATENYGLLAIPLFMLVGELMSAGGITARLIRAASVAAGATRGGLAYVNLLANTMVASILGSAVVQIAVMSRVMVPEMAKHGYSRDFAAATTAAGGLLSPVIPPSMLFIIFGVIAQVSIGDMFLAGILPGVLMLGGFVLAVRWLGRTHDYPRAAAMSSSARRRAVLDGLPAAAIPAVILGSVMFGIATPTEAAALAALAAVILGRWYYRELEWAQAWRAVVQAGMNASVILFIIATAGLFGWVLVFEQLPQQLAGALVALTADPFVFMLLTNVALLLIGTVIDGIPAMIMVAPILLPIATGVYGIDPFHFGVVMCINLVLGLLTPPVGTGLYVASAAAGIPPGRVFVAVLPFLVTTAVVLGLVSWQPWLATALVR